MSFQRETYKMDTYPSMECGRASDFWRMPAELRSAPEEILEPTRGRAFRPRARNSALRASGGALPAASSPPKRAAEAPRRERVVKKAVASSSAADSCLANSNRVGYCRVRACDRIVAVPPSPRQYCKDLVDNERELLVVEMKAAPDAREEAWLDDEKVGEVLVRTADADLLIPRSVLKLYVSRNVSLSKPTRNLSKALNKMCCPLGTAGPTVALLQVKELINAVPSTSLRPSSSELLRDSSRSVFL